MEAAQTFRSRVCTTGHTMPYHTLPTPSPKHPHPPKPSLPHCHSTYHRSVTLYSTDSVSEGDHEETVATAVKLEKQTGNISASVGSNSSQLSTRFKSRRQGPRCWLRSPDSGKLHFWVILLYIFCPWHFLILIIPSLGLESQIKTGVKHRPRPDVICLSAPTTDKFLQLQNTINHD